MNDNVITIAGNLTRDPELRFTTGGKGVCNFSVASGRRYQVNGEWQEQTTFFDVTAWAPIGENAAASLQKGQRVVVIGRMESRDWEDQEGNKRKSFSIIADEVAVSLRWARATVEKVVREGGNGGSKPSQPAPAGGGYVKPNTDPVYGDEEPF